MSGASRIVAGFRNTSHAERPVIARQMTDSSANVCLAVCMTLGMS